MDVSQHGAVGGRLYLAGIEFSSDPRSKKVMRGMRLESHCFVLLAAEQIWKGFLSLHILKTPVAAKTPWYGAAKKTIGGQPKATYCGFLGCKH